MKVFKRFWDWLLLPTKAKRATFFLLSDCFIILFSFFFSFYLRFGFIFPEKYQSRAIYWLVGIIILEIGMLTLFGIYKINWRFVGITELASIIKSWILSTSLLYAGNIFITEYLPSHNLPRGIIIINSIISFGLIALLRISKRIYLELLHRQEVSKRTLIVGADYTSERLVKELRASRPGNLFPIAFIDENKMVTGTKINGLPVMTGFESIEKVIKEFKIECVLINLPRASHVKIRELFNMVNKAGIYDIKIVPKIDQFNTYINTVKDIKNLNIDDLLSRESVKIDFEEIRDSFQNKTILVSGAAGSIGSEIIRKLIQFGVKKIIGYEIDETEVYNFYQEISHSTSKDQHLVFIIGDIRDEKKLSDVFNTYRPDIIFHAAAYKHVPLMEEFPEEAVKTNILGTVNIMKLSLENQVEKFINISTDKAVNPASIMGASKRIGEMIGISMNSTLTKFISVRFGNVVGSRGSVIPLFLNQIKSGGPVTVTHKHMKRYFMSIPEAVLLVFQAAHMGEGGEVFILDMGEPVKITDLVENLIRINNMEPYRDIEIRFVGLRPGEKLFEELLTAEEGTEFTSHQKIFIAKNSRDIKKIKDLAPAIEELRQHQNNPQKIRELFVEYVPFYKNSHHKNSKVN